VAEKERDRDMTAESGGNLIREMVEGGKPEDNGISRSDHTQSQTRPPSLAEQALEKESNE
jgi:hypothetical protein